MKASITGRMYLANFIARIVTSSMLRQCVDNELLIGTGSAVGDGYSNILLAVLAEITHRHSGAVEVQGCSPKLFSGLCVKGTELSVVGRRDEDQAACRYHRSA